MNLFKIVLAALVMVVVSPVAFACDGTCEVECEKCERFPVLKKVLRPLKTIKEARACCCKEDCKCEDCKCEAKVECCEPAPEVCCEVAPVCKVKTRCVRLPRVRKVAGAVVGTPRRMAKRVANVFPLRCR